jgi:hypothetical protein
MPARRSIVDQSEQLHANLPVFETNVSVLASSCVDTYSKDHEAENRDDLNGAEVELDFAIKVYRQAAQSASSPHVIVRVILTSSGV